MSNHNSNLPWREWGAEAFAEAKAADKPVLLDIGAVWCHWCHVMDTGIPGDPVHTGTYSNPEVQQRILSSFIPIKVDNDRRPDINARYNMGGWPTTAFLTPDGDTLYGETYVEPRRMIGLLDHISNLWANHKDEIATQAIQMRQQRAETEALTPSALDPATTETVLTSITRQFDPVYGGFGSQPKFPHPNALRLVLEEYAFTHDPALREVAEKTLHGMADGGMYDQYAGGFFRYSTTRDWSVPHFEKMLEDNAKLTSVYTLAAQVLDDPYYLEVVKSAHTWLLSEMRDPETGCFAGSQDADAEEAYYGQPLSVRATLPTPYIDRTVYTGWNALMVSALVARYKITGETEILEAARKTFSQLYRQGEAIVSGVSGENMAAWWHDEEAKYPLGLLVDQSAMINAGLHFYEVSDEALDEIGNGDGFAVNGLIVALSAANFVLAHLADIDNGGFRDSPINDNHIEAIGELARPKKDITENAEAALALIRLSGFTEDAQYKQAAERALALFVDKYADYGYFSSSYARAVQAATTPGLHITIVGERGNTTIWELQQAAWSHVAPAKTVETLNADAALKRQLPESQDGRPYATVCFGTVCSAPVTTVEELRAALGRTRP